jgi:D-alanyl-D-alanine dipeptidase
MGYTIKGNMTGVAAYPQVGLGNIAIVHKQMWEKLEKLIPYLEENDRYIKVFDAYRPPEAQILMKKIIPIDGYFAADPERSQHCHATAVDICLCDSNKQELKYPTPLDAYTPENADLIQQAINAPSKEECDKIMDIFSQKIKKAGHDYTSNDLTEEEIKNREELKDLMEGIGLYSLFFEWWHYNLFPREQYNNLPLADFVPFKK